MYQLLQKTLLSAAFAGVVLLLCKLLRGKAHKRVLVLMQWLTFAVLVFPLKIKFNAFSMLFGWLTKKRDEQNLALFDSMMQSRAAVPAGAAAIPRTFTPANNFSLPLLLWALGIGAFAVYFLFSYLVLKRWILKSAQPVSLELGSWHRRFDRRTLTTYSMANIRSPFTFGLLRPCIVLPDWCLTLPEMERRMMLEHELTHVRHLDVAKKALAACACCVFWFNPLVWALRAQMNSMVEMVCDEAATQHGTRREYAMLLLQVASRPKARLSAAFSEGSIKSRVTNLSKAAGKSIVIDLAVMLLLGLSFTCYEANGELDPTQIGKQYAVSVVVEEGEAPPEVRTAIPKEKNGKLQ